VKPAVTRRIAPSRAPRSQPPPLRKRDEARALFRNAIVEAAEQVFAERGFHAARIADIAARARIAVGTVYNHFEQKEDVLHALLDERCEALLAQLLPAADEPRDFEARLTSRIARMLAYVEAHRAFFAIAFEYGVIGAGSVTANAQLAGRRVRQMSLFRNAFRALIEDGIESGALEELDADRLARFLGGVIRAFVAAAVLEKGAPIESEAPFIARLFLRGAGRTAKKKR
jgi:AcrR family transcriptional regulator